jgi:hypothetical protein
MSLGGSVFLTVILKKNKKVIPISQEHVFRPQVSWHNTNVLCINVLSILMYYL